MSDYVPAALVQISGRVTKKRQWPKKNAAGEPNGTGASVTVVFEGGVIEASGERMAGTFDSVPAVGEPCEVLGVLEPTGKVETLGRPGGNQWTRPLFAVEFHKVRAVSGRKAS